MPDTAAQLRAAIQAGLDRDHNGVLSTSEQVQTFTQMVDQVTKMIQSPEMGKLDARSVKLLIKTPEQIQKLFPEMVKDFGLNLKVEPISLEQATVLAPIYNNAVKDAVAHRK